jgi:hypothetical protein
VNRRYRKVRRFVFFELPVDVALKLQYFWRRPTKSAELEIGQVSAYKGSTDDIVFCYFLIARCS